MRVGLDIRYLSHGLTGGVRTYVHHLAHRLPGVASDLEFVFYADGKAPLELGDLPANVTLRMLPWRSAWTSLWNDRRVASRMDTDRIDVAHHPGNYGRRGRCPMILTVHDSLNLFPLRKQVRGLYSRPRLLAATVYLAWRTRTDIARADRIITPSEHARQDLHQRTAFPLDRITAIHSAAGPEFRPIEDRAALEALRARLGLRRGVILADAIKNPLALVRAYGGLPTDIRDTYDVVFFSRETRPRDELARSLTRTPALRFIARPATTELAGLMNLAAVFVFPSWYEGFGLPLVEAMQCGTPVMGSTRGSIPEVVGGAGVLFDVDDPSELTNHLARVLGSEEERQEMRRRSLARATAFNWERTARQTADVYRLAAATSIPDATNWAAPDSSCEGR